MKSQRTAIQSPDPAPPSQVTAQHTRALLSVCFWCLMCSVLFPTVTRHSYIAIDNEIKMCCLHIAATRSVTTRPTLTCVD